MESQVLSLSCSHPPIHSSCESPLSNHPLLLIPNQMGHSPPSSHTSHQTTPHSPSIHLSPMSLLSPLFQYSRQSHNHIHVSTPLSSLHQTHILLHTRDDDSTNSHSMLPLPSHTQSSLLHSHTPSQFGTTHHSSTLHIATLFHSSHRTPFPFLLSSSTPHHQSHLCKPLHFPQQSIRVHSYNSQYHDALLLPTPSNLHSSVPFRSHTM